MIFKIKTNKKILFLHGLFGQYSSKPEFLRSLGYSVDNPILSDWSFEDSINTAQDYYNKNRPDLIIGSSRGGAVAMNIDSKETPLLLLAPAWCYFGSANNVKKNCTIVHSEKDIMVPLSSSKILHAKSRCELIIAGEDHRLNCIDAKNAIKNALDKILN
jgi:hypothetical protein